LCSSVAALCCFCAEMEAGSASDIASLIAHAGQKHGLTLRRAVPEDVPELVALINAAYAVEKYA